MNIPGGFNTAFNTVLPYLNVEQKEPDLKKIGHGLAKGFEVAIGLFPRNKPILDNQKPILAFKDPAVVGYFYPFKGGR